MAYEPRRTLLVALSALAVVLAASLFPAAGVGSHPGGEIGGEIPDRKGPGGPEPVEMPEPTDTTERPSPTPRPTAAPSPTDELGTPVTNPDGPDGAILPALSLANLLELLGLMLLAGVLLTLGVVLRGARPGTPYVDLPGGITIRLPFVVPAWLARLPTRLSRTTMGFVVGLSATVPKLLDATGRALHGVAGGLAIAFGESLRGSTRLLTALPRALSAGVAGLAAIPTGVMALPGALARLRSGLGASGPARPGSDARSVAPDPETADGDGGDAGPPGVEEAWVRMTELVPVSRSASTTPTEFARAAVDRGLPAEPVDALTRAFQEVAYGGRQAGEYGDLARRALAHIREHLGGDAG